MAAPKLPSHIGYHSLAVLFLMFDIETVMLYPWAVVEATVWIYGSREHRVLPVGISIRPGLCLAERSIGMEVNKRASIKSIPYDEFKDNDTLEKIAQELNEGGANVVVGSLRCRHQLGTQ